MEHQLLLSFDDHDTHDPEWIVVFAHHESPVCLACIIQNLEVSRTNTSVQKDFHLSLMRSVLSESQEVSSLLQQHPRVCQHVIDIITECYTDGRHLTSSSEICAQILDTVQSENLYIYFLDKFAFQVKEKTESAQFYVATLEKLALISSAYILILVHIHEPLLKMLLEKWLTVPSFDEAAHCSMTVMLAQLYGEAVLPVVPPYILSTINKYLLNCLLSARSLELQVSTLELLQKVLQCACGPAEDLEDCEKLVLGLKRHLVSRRDTHCIAVAQCLNAVASRPCHNVCLQHVLKSDLPEFLFESLYTINVAQLDAIITCLQSLAQSELFFSRCHAVYGMESILQMVSMTMTTQNNKMLYKALTLLAFIMERQTAGVPLFLSMATQQFAQSMLVKAVRTPYLPVVCAAVRCATTQFTDENLCISAAIASVESITGDACSNIGAALMEENPHALLRSLGLSRDELLGRLLAFLCAVTKTVGNTRKKATPTLHDREVLFKIVEQCISVILPVCASNLEQCGEGVAHGLLCFLKTLYTCVGDERRLLHLAESLLTSGFILEILVSRAQWRCHNELDAISTDVLIHTFTFLVMSTSPHLQTLPLCLHHGLKQLLLNKNLQIAPCEPEDAETSLALIMVLYYACLMETQLPPSAQILYVVADVFTRHPGILGLHQLASKFFLFLTAWLREHVDKDIQQIHTFCAELKNLEYEIMEHIIELPVDTWATFHPVVFLWSFDGHQRAEQAGTKILEHWLFHIKEKCKKDNSSSDNYGVFITLFHSEHFRFVLLNLISAMHKEISFLAEQLFMDTLISMPGSSSETKELLSKLYSEVVLHFQHLFMQSLHPDRNYNTVSYCTTVNLMCTWSFCL